jgi:hypothetical protein
MSSLFWLSTGDVRLRLAKKEFLPVFIKDKKIQAGVYIRNILTSRSLSLRVHLSTLSLEPFSFCADISNQVQGIEPLNAVGSFWRN